MRLYAYDRTLARPCPRCGRLDAAWTVQNLGKLTYAHPCGQPALADEAVATHRVATGQWPAERDDTDWPAPEADGLSC